MLTRLLGTVAVVSATAGLLAGCTSSSSPSSPPSAGAAGSATTGSGPAPTAAGLADQLNTALDALTSAHLDIDAGGLGGKSTADVALDHGQATAVDVHLTESGKPVEQISVGGTSWVKVPGASGKPWIKVSPTSSNPIAKALATGISVVGFTSSLGVVADLARSSTDLVDRGSEPVNGVSTTHYTMKLNPKLVKSSPQVSGLLSALGSTPIPVDLWLDAQDRPAKFTIHVAIAGTQFPVTVAVSRFNSPVSITAPPPSQVAD
jgi:hypothetical protein